jgi:hypothetical protein
MAIRTHIARAAVVGASLAAIAAAPAFGRTLPIQQDQASQLRSHALNVIYGLGHPTTVTHAQYRAALIRAEAMNERYGIPTLGSGEIVRLFGTGLHPTTVAPSATSPPPSAHRPGPQP